MRASQGSRGARGRTISNRESVAYCRWMRQRYRAVTNHFQHFSKASKETRNNACEFGRWGTRVQFRGMPVGNQRLVLLPSRPDPKVKVTHAGSTAPPAARSAAFAVAYWS